MCDTGHHRIILCKTKLTQLSKNNVLKNRYYVQTTQLLLQKCYLYYIIKGFIILYGRLRKSETKHFAMLVDQK